MTTGRQLSTGRIIVYYKPRCPFAIRLRVALRLRNVPFVSVRFRDDETGAAAVRAANNENEISPTVSVNGHWLTNPSAKTVIGTARQQDHNDAAPNGN